MAYLEDYGLSDGTIPFLWISARGKHIMQASREPAVLSHERMNRGYVSMGTILADLHLCAEADNLGVMAILLTRFHFSHGVPRTQAFDDDDDNVVSIWSLTEKV